MSWSTKSSTTTYNSTPSTVVVAGGGGSGGTNATMAISYPGNYPASNTYLSSGSSGVSWNTLTQPTVSINGTIKVDSDTPTIQTKKHKINIDQLYENLQIVNEMFHIIVPNWNKLEKDSTLMDAFMQYDNAKHIEPRYNSEQYIAAYEQYKLLEALTEEKNDNS
jgi:hypothetical protein